MYLMRPSIPPPPPEERPRTVDNFNNHLLSAEVFKRVFHLSYVSRTAGMNAETPAPVLPDMPTTCRPATCGNMRSTALAMCSVASFLALTGRASNLFATTTNALPSSMATLAKDSSVRTIIPRRLKVSLSRVASMRRATTCALRILRRVSSIERPDKSLVLIAFAFLIQPAVSNNHTFRSLYKNLARTASLVMPGSAPVMQRSSPNRRFTNVDLPALGNPTMANCMGPSSSSISCSDVPACWPVASTS
mmetsp:Transcript_6897/g.42096  ORF Transcript_6897/g.42096 Transcript_6897/m.42096 type:complete len:248 (-) Transcript_6897:676-1419(-)